MLNLTTTFASSSLRRASAALTICLAAAGLFSAPSTAQGSLLGDFVGRAVGSEFTKRIGDHVRGATATPVSLPQAGSFNACKDLFPGGVALSPDSFDKRWRPVALCSNHFAVLYSGLSKTPLVVVERLNRNQLSDALNAQRTDEFFADPRVPARLRADLDDYRGSGYDRGHMAAAANQPNQTSMAQSFALTNMVPQDPVNNQKVWSKIESDVRKFARRANGNVFVFTGPLFRGDPQTIGRGKVWVPTHLYKLVHEQASGRSWAYVLENSASARVTRPMSYEEFVQQTGMQLLR